MKNITFLLFVLLLISTFFGCADTGTLRLSPAQFAGDYIGTYFDGTMTDMGTIDATIDTSGNVTGNIASTVYSYTGTFTGTVDGYGNLSMTSAITGVGTVTFSGTVWTDGVVVGSWSNQDNTMTGGFIGAKQ
jgi:hypothetical protein